MEEQEIEHLLSEWVSLLLQVLLCPGEGEEEVKEEDGDVQGDEE